MKVQVQQIFEYLLAVKNMTTPPIRDYREYDFYWKIDELAVEEGCYLFGKGEDEEAWLEIHKQTLDLPPKPDISIKAWLKTDYTKENIEPEVYEEKEYPPKRNQTDPFEKKIIGSTFIMKRKA
ncbi:hypothetical protein [Aneurinibacillus tyrosinisolvens]|uniref:hypothetical protein n=1 Tax=Aneurinibacillus tyrosinisolvens TaxID=1443435 RepID=UPI00063EE2BC|nr:hypothetical protein [Aneurinibacillus tyrosinisolvens]